MSTKVFVLVLATILLATVPPAHAQQPSAKVPRIGYLSAALRSGDRGEGFRQGLKELGYIQGKSITIEYRFAEGKIDRLSDLAGELVRLIVDVIVATSTPAVVAAKSATREIPIVFNTTGDPVERGVVATLARPGGNITGITRGGAELYGKRLELLKETIPKLSRAAFMWNPESSAAELNLKETQASAQALGLQFRSLEVRTPEDIEPAFDAAVRAKAGGIVMAGVPPINTHPKQIVDLAAKHRLPAIYNQSQWPDAGGLMSYASNTVDSDRHLARYVDRILKGAKPADMPVERTMRFELIINLKTAKQIGLTIPPNVLARADRVIKDAPG
jgi:putative tryptophan/tyrosine transport system substrate-binding protein